MDLEVTWPTVDLLSRQAQSNPNRIALVHAESGLTWRYGELSSGPVASLTAGIRAAGLTPGDHLGVVADPGIELANVVHAAARAGVVFCPLPPDGPPDLVDRRCAVADVETLVTTAGARESPPGFDGETRSVAGLRSSADPPPPHKWSPDSVQWLVFTSGTTDEPRPVQLTAGNLIASATASAHRLGVEADDQWLACLPMHHVGGLAPLVRSALYGTAAMVQAGFDTDETAAVLSREPVTGVSLVPTMLTRLLDAGWTPSEPLRFVLLGGAPASAELIDRCASAGVPVYPTYGATETASQIATAPPEIAFASPGTVGPPLPGAAVSVMDPGGIPLPPGSVGELVVSGPMVSPGYYDDPEATVDRFTAGTFHTRDRGYLDGDGQLWVVGRLDDAIVTGGETVQPDTVERALSGHPDVAETAVVGLPDDEWGEIVAGLVTPVDGATIDVSSVRGHARDRLEPNAVPKLLVPAESLPRTVSGTVDRRSVRDRLREVRRRDGA